MQLFSCVIWVYLWFIQKKNELVKLIACVFFTEVLKLKCEILRYQSGTTKETLVNMNIKERESEAFHLHMKLPISMHECSANREF